MIIINIGILIILCIIRNLGLKNDIEYVFCNWFRFIYCKYGILLLYLILDFVDKNK